MTSVATAVARLIQPLAPMSSEPRDLREVSRSLREVHRPRLAYHGHLDLAGVLELLLDVAGDPVREQSCLVVVDVLGLDDQGNLPPLLHRVRLLAALVALGDLLELAQPLRVVLERLA